MNKISSNEKYHCIYNIETTLIFNSNDGRYFPLLKGIKFAELDKYNFERILLFNGKLIEFNLDNSSYRNHDINNFSDIFYCVVLYQTEKKTINFIFVLNNFVYYNFHKICDFDKFEVLSCFEQATVSILESNKLYLLDISNKFYCFDTNNKCIIKSFFLGDVVNNNIFPNSKLKFINYLENINEEYFIILYPNEENRPKFIILCNSFIKFDKKDEIELNKITFEKNSLFYEGNDHLALHNELYSILILKCQKQFEKKKIREPKLFFRVIIINNQTKLISLVHIRLKNLKFYSHVHFKGNDCLILSILYETNCTEIYQIQRNNQVFEAKLILEFIIDDKNDLYVHNIINKEESVKNLNANQELPKEIDKQRNIYKIILDNERIDNYIHDYLQKLEQSITSQLYSQLKIIENANYEEQLINQKLLSLYSSLTNQQQVINEN